MKQVIDRLISMLALGIILNVFFIFNASSADIEKLTEQCADCHGKDGASTESDIPIIGGYSAQYILDTMTAYRNKERPCHEEEYQTGKNKGSKTDMCKIAKDLNDQETQEIADYYASKKFVRAKQTVDQAKVAQGEKIHETNCEKCHENGGSSPDDDAGILAGQWMPYLESTFKEYASNKRTQPKKMKPKMEKLSDTDIEELIHYYGSFE